MTSAKIRVSSKSGIIHGVVIQTDKGVCLATGSNDASFDGELAAKTRVIVTVVGAAGAMYELKVDLPGKANDFTMTLKLVENAQTLAFDLA